MGSHWWVYLILVIGIITFWSVVRSILAQTRWRRIKGQHKFKVTAKGRQQLDVLPEGSTSYSTLEERLLQFFASSEEGRYVEDFYTEISLQDFRAMIYKSLLPKGTMASGDVSAGVFEKAAETTASALSPEDYWKAIRYNVASLEKKGDVEQEGVSWG